METNPRRCPVCGARLKIEPGDKMVTCEYCGTKVQIDDETDQPTYYGYSSSQSNENSNTDENNASPVKTIIMWIVIAFEMIIFSLFFIWNRRNEGGNLLGALLASIFPSMIVLYTYLKFNAGPLEKAKHVFWFSYLIFVINGI